MSVASLSPQPRSVQVEAFRSRPRARVMLVDDQPVNIQAMHQIFDGMYDLVFATSGERALALCLDVAPDIMLLDVDMPDMNGLALCNELKRHDRTRDIAVIFVTAGDGVQEENACWAAGGVDFIAKPINAATIKHRVHAHLTLKLQADRLRKMAFIDGLTGVANRRYFDDLLANEWRRQRGRAALSVVMIDVDRFKLYNDRYGHVAGDDCLRQVATAIGSCLRRPHDLLARYGGEEFACVLPQTDLSGASGLCQKMEKAVRALNIAHDTSDTAAVVTVSIGAAEVAEGDDSAAEVVRRADSALYFAKQAGRGRIHPAS
ncbi:MAG: diguanylate cyclase [Herminiimonas sp.]|nr:diguanylate cyclase [Herminiimonas sp.]